VSPASPERPPPFAESWIRASRPLPAQAGLNRFVWDLRIAPPEPLRTAQLPANGVEDDPWALVPPGSYRVRLTAGEQNQSQPLEIRQDPRAAVPRGELIEQYAFGRQIRDEADKTNRAFNRIEAERRKRKSSTFDERALAIAGNADGWPAEGSLLDVSGRLEALARVVGSADGLPTQASREVFALLDRQLAARLVEAQRLQSPQR